MKECKIRGALYDESHALMEWQEPRPVHMPGMIEAIKHIKYSINDYLTHLVNKEKAHNLKDEAEYFDDNEDEQEEIQEDRISGLIRGISAIHGKYIGNVKRKINSSNQVKKFKK